MSAGSPGDHPITDICFHRLAAFSPRIDALIREIAQYLSFDRLYDLYPWYDPPPLEVFEQQLLAKRDELRRDAAERGWEPKDPPA